MSYAEMFCGPYLNAQRIQRYKRAYPEDKRTDQEILDELDRQLKEKRFMNRFIKMLTFKKQ